MQFKLTPLNARNLRTFSFDYDAVLHQVVTRSVMVYVRQDWGSGTKEENEAQQIGVINMDVSTGKILPLQVSLQNESWWKDWKMS